MTGKWTLLLALFLIITSSGLFIAKEAYATCFAINHRAELIDAVNPKFIQCDYKKYSVIVSCSLKLPLMSWTSIDKDIGDVDTSSRNYRLDLEATLKQYRHETRQQLLYISLCLGGFLSAMGCLNALAPFVDDTLFVDGPVTGMHRALFDGVTVVISGWLFAGGSEGWNSVTKWVEESINPMKS